MSVGIGFRVAPGIRIRMSRRGPRGSLGSRVVRVHADGGARPPPTVDVAWHRLSGGGHAAPAAPGTDRKHHGWTTVGEHLDRLLSAHLAPVERARPPVVAPPSVVRRSFRRARGHGVFAGRPGLLRPRIIDGVDDDRSDDGRADRQRAADDWWERLLANDPATVATRLEDTFGTHGFSAAVAAVDGECAHLVVSVGTPKQLIGHREPTSMGPGGVSLRRLSEPRRHELYDAAISSGILAIAAEVFAVSPGLGTIKLAVVAPAHIGEPAVLALIVLHREAVLPDGVARSALNDLAGAAEQGRAALVRDKGGQTGALRPLARGIPDVDILLDAIDV